MMRLAALFWFLCWCWSAAGTSLKVANGYLPLTAFGPGVFSVQWTSAEPPGAPVLDGCVGLWTNAIGDILADAANGATASNMNGATASGNIMVFDGVDDYWLAGDAFTRDLGNEFTILFWVTLSEDRPVSFVGCGTGVAPGDGRWFVQRFSDELYGIHADSLMLRLSGSYENIIYSSQAGTLPADDAWHSVALSVQHATNGETRALHARIDGIESAMDDWGQNSGSKNSYYSSTGGGLKIGYAYPAEPYHMVGRILGMAISTQFLSAAACSNYLYWIDPR